MFEKVGGIGRTKSKRTEKEKEDKIQKQTHTQSAKFC